MPAIQPRSFAATEMVQEPLRQASRVALLAIAMQRAQGSGPHHHCNIPIPTGHVVRTSWQLSALVCGNCLPSTFKGISFRELVRHPETNWLLNAATDILVSLVSQLEWHSPAVQALRRSDKGQILTLLPNDSISCLAASPNGRFLAVGSFNGEVSLLNLTNGDLMHVHHAFRNLSSRFKDSNNKNKRPYGDLQWSPNGRHLAIDFGTGAVNIWDRQDSTFTRVLGTSPVWSPNGSKICTALMHESACIIWNVSTGAIEDRITLKDIQKTPPYLAWSAQGEILAYFSEFEYVEMLWRILPGEMPSFRRNSEGLAGLKFNALAGAFAPPLDEEHDPDMNGISEVIYKILIPKYARSLRQHVWQRSGSLQANVDGRVDIWLYDSLSDRVVRKIRQHKCPENIVFAVEWSMCEKFLFVGIGGGCLRIFHVEELNRVEEPSTMLLEGSAAD